ncbi:MAG: hypothetical protein NVS4B11_28860 [Ktedonobacteraceae bacterium]
MATSKSLAKMRVASKLCKLGAWVIGVVGLVATVFYAVITIPAFRDQQGQNTVDYLSIILPFFLIVVPTLFFLLILYAVGVLMEYISTETKIAETKVVSEEDDDERLKIVPIPEMR